MFCKNKILLFGCKKRVACWYVQSFNFHHLNSCFACNDEDQGDYVVREGEVADGIYFIWEGEVTMIFIIHY